MTDPAPEPSPPAAELTAAERLAIALGTAPAAAAESPEEPTGPERA